MMPQNARMDERQQHIAVARARLAALRSAFERATRALAAQCSRNGRLSSEQLDAQQVPSFELAWAAADLLAAETCIARLQDESSELDTRLALLFAVDAAAAVQARLETVFLDLALPLADLDISLIHI
jgi:(2S)-methylsuccinyl-CoA dehydrogenase